MKLVDLRIKLAFQTKNQHTVTKQSCRTNQIISGNLHIPDVVFHECQYVICRQMKVNCRLLLLRGLIPIDKLHTGPLPEYSP